MAPRFQLRPQFLVVVQLAIEDDGHCSSFVPQRLTPTVEIEHGQSPVAQIAMAKNYAARSMQFCADAAVQILGGTGFMRGTRVERIYREVKVNAIGGGTEEIMKDLASRQMGL